MFGDYAEVVLTARFAPGVGSSISYTPPPPPGTATVAGLGSITFDLLGCSPNGGQWTLTGSGFGGTTGTTWGVRSGWALGSPGTPTNGDVLNCNAGQFVIPGQTASPLNPVIEIWRGKWVPPSWGAGQSFRFAVAPTASYVLGQYAPGQHIGIPVQSIASNINIIIDPGSPGPCFPFIFQGPQSTVGYLGYRASFNVSAGPGTGCAPLTYTWRRGCTILANGGSISGANTSTLVIDPVSAADAGPYEVSVNSYATPTATLSVTCYSNCDASTVSPLLNVNDFTCFQNHFAAGASSANCDLSTAPPLLTVNDFICFINKYAAGCS
jgi:hypothetical protein